MRDGKIAEGQNRQRWVPGGELRERVRSLLSASGHACQAADRGDGRAFLEALGELDANLRDVRDLLTREAIPSRRGPAPESRGERRQR